MDLLNLSIYSVGNSRTNTTDTVAMSEDLSHEFSQILHLLKQSELSNPEGANIAYSGDMVTDRDQVEDDRRPLENVIDFMVSIESQVDHVNGKTTNAVPLPEVISAFSDLFAFLKTFRQRLVGGDETGLTKGDNLTDAYPGLAVEKTELNDLIEIEKVLYELRDLIVKRGSAENVSVADRVEVGHLPLKHISGRSDENQHTLSKGKIVPRETPRLESQKPEAITRPLMSNALHSEFKESVKIEKGTMISNILVPSNEFHLNVDEVQTSAGATSSQKSVYLVNATDSGSSLEVDIISNAPAEHNQLQDLSVNEKPELDKVDIISNAPAEHNQLQDLSVNEKPELDVEVTKRLDLEVVVNKEPDRDIDVNKKPNLQEALAPLRYLLMKLQVQRLDQPISLTPSDQSKLVEAARLLRSINLEDVNFVRNSDNKQPYNSVPKLHGTTDKTYTEPMDTQTLEVLAQAVLSESKNQTLDTLQIARTPHVVFPTELTEKIFIFDAESHIGPFAGSAVEEDLVLLHNANNNKSISERNIALDDSKQSDLDPTLWQDGDPQKLSESNPEERIEHSDTTQPMVATAAVISDDPSTDDVEAFEEVDMATSRTSKSNSPSNVVTSTLHTELPESLSEHEMAVQPDKLISDVPQSAQQNHRKSEDIPVQSAQPPVEKIDPLKYTRPVIRSDKILSQNSVTVQVIEEAKGKDAAQNHVVHSTISKSNHVEVKSQTINKPQAYAKSVDLETTSSKNVLRSMENMPDPGSDTAKKVTSYAPTLGIPRTAKKVVLKQKEPGAVIEKKHFDLPEQKLKQQPLVRNGTSRSHDKIDFSAKAADALRSQLKDQTLQKVSGSTNLAPFAVINADPVILNQTSLVMANNNMGVQAHSGSERLEKWIDTQLDLTSRSWVNNLAKTIATAINRGQQQLTLALSPPSLGRINIIFNVKSAGLDLRIQADRKATLSLLSDAEIKLVSNLENTGHKVSNLSYVEMRSSENNFDFDYNQSAKGGKDNADQHDSSVQENLSETVQVSQENSGAKKIDDESLVNITV